MIQRFGRFFFITTDKLERAEVWLERYEAGGVFFRNASGALMLAYVAAGRLIGYTEQHMNGWDCLAGLLMIEEAGGRVEPFDHADPVREGTVAIAGGPHVFDEIRAMSARAYGLAAPR